MWAHVNEAPEASTLKASMREAEYVGSGRRSRARGWLAKGPSRHLGNNILKQPGYFLVISSHKNFQVTSESGR